MLVLAVDPDLHHTGVALVTETEILDVKCCRVDKEVLGIDAVVAMVKALWVVLPHVVADRTIDLVLVEGQRIYSNTKGRRVTQNPMSILHLAQVAGAAASTAQVYTGCLDLRVPFPQEWKGSIEKSITQRRALLHYGIEPKTTTHTHMLDRYTYPAGLTIPGMVAPILKSEWSHVVDAIALGLWGAVGSRVAADRLARAQDPALNALLGREGVSGA